jgi:hypothetical protein
MGAHGGGGLRLVLSPVPKSEGPGAPSLWVGKDTETGATRLALVIIWAIKNYFLLTQHLATEMTIFLTWFAVAEPQLVMSATEDMMTKAIAEMRSNISGDPYDRSTLKTIHTAMNDV